MQPVTTAGRTISDRTIGDRQRQRDSQTAAKTNEDRDRQRDEYEERKTEL